jgi:alpha-1,3-rhamnosyl/mannosyltransferase
MTGPLRLGVDAHNLLHDRRGIWRYARSVLQRWIVSRPDRVRVVLLMQHPWPRILKRALARLLGVESVSVARRQDAAGVGLNLVWYPWNGMTWISSVPSVATVHDVWPFASPAEDRRKRDSQQAPFRTTAAHARTIVTDSQFSKNEIHKYLSVPAQRLHVVPLGVDAPRVDDSPLLLDGASRYVLFVGENEPRKDLATLQAALAQLPDALRMTTGCVIAGGPRPSGDPTGRISWTRQEGRHATVLRFARGPQVPSLITGPIEDELLQRLYAGAAVLAFPSQYEGFGLPILEAMARGTPVIAADAASIPEVAGDAALYFTPGDADSLARELTCVLSDRMLVARLSAAGVTRAAQFSWDRCADDTLSIFETVAAEGKL